MQIPDIPRLYTAFAEWAACVLFIIFCPKRFNKQISVLLCIVSLVLFGVFHHFAGKLDIIFWIPGMITAFALMNLFIFSVCKISVKKACYCGAQAFIIAEFVAAMEWWLNYFFVANFSVLQTKIFEFFLAVFIYALSFVGLYFFERRYHKKVLNTVEVKDLVSVWVLVIAIFFTSNISFVFDDTPFSSQYPLEIFYSRTLVDFCGILFVYALREQNLNNRIKEELFHVNNLLERQYAQYCMTSDTIDAINRKYHDLKHYLLVLRREYGNTEEGMKIIKGVEEETQSFDVIYRTGNKVLDTILTSKAIICLDNGIDFSCKADGNAFSFLSDMDICSIFGNALDNAIESVTHIEDKSKRLIEVTVVRRYNLLVIKCENSFEHELIRQSGTLLTTKKDKQHHGYGIKSIKYVVGNYGGRVNVFTDGNWFTLSIVIPIEQMENQGV